MRRIVGALTLMGLLTAGAVYAQDGPLTLKLKKAGAGEVVKETKTETTETKTLVTADGKARTRQEKVVATFTYTDEVIEKPADARKPTKVKRTYESAELSVNGEKQDLGLKGQTVLIEKKGDKYTFTADGKPVTGKAAGLLGKEFSQRKQTNNEDFLPEKPVKKGETWKIDVAKVAGELTEGGLVIDNLKSTATGKLTKVYTNGSATYGVIEVAMDLVVNKLVAGQNSIPLKEGSKLTVTMTLEGCIDGTEATGGGNMTMKGKLTGDIPGAGQMDVDMTVSVVAKTEQVKK